MRRRMPELLLFAKISVFAAWTVMAIIDWRTLKLQQSTIVLQQEVTSNQKKVIASQNDIISSQDRTIKAVEGQRDIYRAEYDKQQQAISTTAVIAAAHSQAGLFIIHEPAAGCPKGWELKEGLFFASDGSRRNACEFRNGDSADIHIDYLAAGESTGPALELPVEIGPAISVTAN
jgi:hypothetical protein